jgi:hypothetical protein
MNISPIYLVEPYNAYAPKNRKKHPLEILEEQNMLARIVAEQQAQLQAELNALKVQQLAILEARSATVPQDAPNTSQATLQSTMDAAVGPAQGGAAGGGGVPVFEYFHPTGETVSFTRTPSSGDAPLTVTFVNLTPTPQFDTYVWNFGDGTTSSLTNPAPHVYQTGSIGGTVFTASLTASYTDGTYQVYTASISASLPQVTASFTFITTSNTAPFSFVASNTTTNTSQTPTTTYFWLFTNKNVVQSSSLTSPAIVVQSGSFTASLQATGSYGITSISRSMFFATAPTLTSNFEMISSSYSAPSSMTFNNLVTHTGSGFLTFLWEVATGSALTLVSSSTASGPISGIYNFGYYTASLQVTESWYKVSSKTTKYFDISL